MLKIYAERRFMGNGYKERFAIRVSATVIELAKELRAINGL